MARSVLIQSYAPAPLPRWQQRCVDSVREWAQRAGWEYRYVDDRLFEVVPPWYRERCGKQKLPVTDLGRLLLLREALAEADCAEALWIDADVLVFAPQGLQPRQPEGFAFARELWLWRRPGGPVRTRGGINNSLVYVRRGAPMLESFIALCERIVAETPPEKLRHHSASTVPLSRMAEIAPLPVVPGAGILSPQLIAEIAAGGSDLVRHYAALLEAPLCCANLCASLVDQEVWGVTLDEPVLERAVAALLSSRGGAINAFVP